MYWDNKDRDHDAHKKQLVNYLNLMNGFIDFGKSSRCNLFCCGFLCVRYIIFHIVIFQAPTLGQRVSHTRITAQRMSVRHII